MGLWLGKVERKTQLPIMQQTVLAISQAGDHVTLLKGRLDSRAGGLENQIAGSGMQQGFRLSRGVQQVASAAPP